ncbi:hypothetical protein KR054_010150 [Drosophila jambulina]|nr:hypothetical protein KR054_010150 [Drosophila jambulina]
MASNGCVAKVLRGLECRSNVWLKTVNPGWYSAREVPTAMLTKKGMPAAQAATSTKAEKSTQKAGTPMSQPYF